MSTMSLVRHARAKMRALEVLRDWDESKHPREPAGSSEGGQFGSGGGGDGESESEGGGGREHPGKGYSKEAYVKDGVIHTSSVYDAQRALYENRRVDLNQPRTLSVLIKSLGKEAKSMIAKGKEAPNFNLCNVTVKGTSLFCADTKGIPRVQMPQLDKQQTKDFRKYLEDKGYKVEKDKVQASYLRATQNEINGAKVAATAKELEKESSGEIEKRLIISKDNYILDGHHHWAAKVGLDAADNKLHDDTKVKVSRVNISITKLLEEAEKFTGGKGKKPANESKDFDESKHPRDDHGRWSETGGEGGDGESAPAAASEGKAPNPEATRVGGDQWNKETAARLETEYVAAHAELDRIASSAVGGGDAGPTSVAAPAQSADDDEEPSYGSAETWDTMSSDQQDAALTAYQEKTYDEYYQSEVDNWQSETAPDDARYKVAQEFTSGDEIDWARQAIDDWREQRKEDGDPDIPYSTDQILNATKIDHDTGNYPISKGTTIEIDELRLKPDIEAQQDLPGIDSGITALTSATRASLIAAISEGFNDYAKDIEEDLSPPDYLSESVAEYQSESWNSMDDDDKYNWTTGNTDIIEKETTGGGTVAGYDFPKLPENFDPLGKDEGQDYRMTQALATYMASERSAQVLVERGFFKNKESAKSVVKWVDRDLWQGWKSSSTSTGGKILQVAIAEELGGKLREHEDLKSQNIISLANDKYSAIGGFNGIKAYLRGKWETTQYMLDKAGEQKVNVYRAVSIETAPEWNIVEQENGGFKVQATTGATQYFTTKAEAVAFREEQVTKNPPEPVEQVKTQLDRVFEKYPAIDVKRNGAASTTTDPRVANKWDGQSDRVVLRAEVPRTAVVSVPAYGINVHKEREVVIAGTAWVGWDAWKQRAPEFAEVPMQHSGIAA